MHYIEQHYIERINDLIADLQGEWEQAADPSAARNISLAITHLEDALLRIGPPGTYRPNPGRVDDLDAVGRRLFRGSAPPDSRPRGGSAGAP